MPQTKQLQLKISVFRVCSVENCSEQHRANGYCNKHNKRFKKYGNPELLTQEHYGYRIKDHVAHFLSLCQRDAKVLSEFVTTPCWIWQGGSFKDGNDYPRFYVKRKPIRAHRYSYQLFKGTIPYDYTVDHICRRVKCVNPNHLEAVTSEENIRRRDNPVYIEETRGDDYVNF